MTQVAVNKKQRRLLWWLSLVAVGMFGFCFALVPIYSVFCKVTGLNGKTNGMAAAVSTQQVDLSRVITIEFLASTNENLPWEFRPLVNVIKIHPGENRLVIFYAKNMTANDMVVQAIPSVAPGIAAKYLKKTECFCFTQQTFHGNEAREMPVLFHIDPDLPANVNTISLSYTLFDAGRFAKVPIAKAGRITD